MNVVKLFTSVYILVRNVGKLWSGRLILYSHHNEYYANRSNNNNNFKNRILRYYYYNINNIGCENDCNFVPFVIWV
jgi:hypothetical protein